MQNPYFCSAEWHLSRLGKAAMPIYGFALKISKDTGVYTCSVPRIAFYFSYDPKTVRQTHKQLTHLGFFTNPISRDGETTEYTPIVHSKWAEANPGQCVIKNKSDSAVLHDLVHEEMIRRGFSDSDWLTLEYERGDVWRLIHSRPEWAKGKDKGNHDCWTSPDFRTAVKEIADSLLAQSDFLETVGHRS